MFVVSSATYTNYHQLKLNSQFTQQTSVNLLKPRRNKKSNFSKCYKKSQCSSKKGLTFNVGKVTSINLAYLMGFYLNIYSFILPLCQ